MMDQVFYILIMAVMLSACDKKTEIPTGGEETGNRETVTNVSSNLMINITTDKACYSPGEPVRFVADGLVSEAKIRYRNLDKVIKEEPFSTKEWSWTPPSDDFVGYLVDIYKPTDANSEMVFGTIAVDISSDWTRFPRYGFVATFDRSKTDGAIGKEMDFLSRLHMNGVQFQDWHNKHHWPLGGTRDKLDEYYTDIANREISTHVVKKYIEEQHKRGMKSIFYNLCYGALDDAASDGVKEEWYIFKGADHAYKDFHDLPANWKSDIFLLDPSNIEVQNYMAQRNDDVYANFDFDGFQIDQLGDRGDRYNFNGDNVNLPDGFASFIESMKKNNPDKRLIMNAVSQYASPQIARTGKVDFLYNEVWGGESDFEDLHSIIKKNNAYSNNALKTVFAAYMNYNMDNRPFNTPGVLLTDAVMFALGGSHLELGGDHMLCREYFPYSGLTMSEELKASMVHYYDFLTAYQNLLRDKGTENAVDLRTTQSINMDAWPPKTGAITSYAKKIESKQVIHLINFLNATSTNWRDADGKTPAPRLITQLPLILTVSGKINKVWVASPDVHGGAPRELSFKQQNKSISFTLPSLHYWTMIVVEQQ